MSRALMLIQVKRIKNYQLIRNNLSVFNSNLPQVLPVKFIVRGMTQFLDRTDGIFRISGKDNPVRL